MPPNASDPKDLKMVLNPAKRRALTTLLGSIVTHMRKQIEHTFEPSPLQAPAPLLVDPDNSRDQPKIDPEEEARQRRLEARLEHSLSTPKLRELRRDALRYFDTWANEVAREFRKLTEGSEDPRSEQRRREWLAARNPPPPPYQPNAPDITKTQEAEAAALAAEAREVEEAKDVSLLQSLYPPVATRLTTISKDDRHCVISCMVLLLLSLGHYSAHSRTLLCYLTSSLEMPMSVLTTEETEIARTLMLASKTLTADAETKKRQAENASSRRWKVGLASVAGAALIGVTGGLAAPVVAGAIGGIMGGVGLGGVASFLGIFAMNGALVGSLFGAFGGKMTGAMVDQYAKEVSDFKFLPVASEWGEHTTKPETEVESRRLRVTIGINGWLNSKEDVIKPWRIIGQDSEVFALRYEMDALIELGNSLKNMVSSYAWSYVKLEILKRTVLATLWSALWPVYLLKMATSIDNPFAVARNRSEKAGEVLADALINKAQGERPVTLIGYSLGARVIYSCLKSLAERRAFGLVESVVFIGAPVPSNADNWRMMRSVVSGKVFNVYSENDYILAFLYRATSIQFGVAGLQEIGNVEGVSNLDLSREVSGHLRYPELVGKILKRVGVEGVLVEDATIEIDVAQEGSEIKLVDEEDLIDFGDGHEVGNVKGGSFSLVDHDHDPLLHPAPAPPSTPSRPPPAASSSRSAANITDQDPLLNPALPPRPDPPTTHSAPAAIPQLTDTLSNTHLTSPPSTSKAKATDYSSDEDTGIAMLDNDSDPELQTLDCEPIPDYPEPVEIPASQGSEAREGEKVLFENEQKSLSGAFAFPGGEGSGSGG
ncbi:putative membrane protein, partial [Lachnellula willkommii]